MKRDPKIHLRVPGGMVACCSIGKYGLDRWKVAGDHREVTCRTCIATKAFEDIRVLQLTKEPSDTAKAAETFGTLFGMKQKPVGAEAVAAYADVIPCTDMIVVFKYDKEGRPLEILDLESGGAWSHRQLTYASGK
jgi:hypothetical protein